VVRELRDLEDQEEGNTAMSGIVGGLLDKDILM
jgi:hypothetical protein